MKIRFISWLIILSAPFSIRANTESIEKLEDMTEIQARNAVSPVDSVSFTIDLEDEDGIYISPQPVAFTVRADMPKDKPDFNLVCKITTDNYLPVDSFSFIVKPELSGKIVQPVFFTPPAAGFYRISVCTDSKEVKSRIEKFNIGYNPEQIMSPPDSKPDFTEFWKKALAELKEIEPRYKTTLLKEKSSDSKDIYHVEMYSLGNVKIEGYYSVPKKQGKHPAIIRYIGYGANPHFPDANAMPDFCEFVLSIRGQGIQKPVNPYGEWIVYGLPEKETYYYRGAYMDLIRGIDFLSSRPEVNLEKIVAEGASQGGAFTLVACALDKRIKAAAPCVPFLSDFRDYFKICPWPRLLFESYLEKHPNENWDEIYDLLSYFDIKNLAGQITCPVIMEVGLQDDVCPPHTNFSGYNLINAEKKYYVYPKLKHGVDQSWRLIRESFFREKTNTLLSE